MPNDAGGRFECVKTSAASTTSAKYFVAPSSAVLATPSNPTSITLRLTTRFSLPKPSNLRNIVLAEVMSVWLRNPVGLLAEKLKSRRSPYWLVSPATQFALTENDTHTRPV